MVFGTFFRFSYLTIVFLYIFQQANLEHHVLGENNIISSLLRLLNRENLITCPCQLWEGWGGGIRSYLIEVMRLDCEGVSPPPSPTPRLFKCLKHSDNYVTHPNPNLFSLHCSALFAVTVLHL